LPIRPALSAFFCAVLQFPTIQLTACRTSIIF
jgi:hypothetical protein